MASRTDDGDATLETAIGGKPVQLKDSDTGLLEDCYEDWRALWEVPSIPPKRSIADSVKFILPLIAERYLAILKVTTWDQAPTATPISFEDALTVARVERNYLPSENIGDDFYLLSITAKGKAAIPPGAFPEL
jgi:hypothetical protein